MPFVFLEKSSRRVCNQSGLLFLVSALSLTLSLNRGAVLLRLRFGVGLFHGLAVFLGTFGAYFCALLALFIDHLLAAQKFDERLFSAVALAPGGTNDP